MYPLTQDGDGGIYGGFGMSDVLCCIQIHTAATTQITLTFFRS